jgi:hypothetical protein
MQVLPGQQPAIVAATIMTTSTLGVTTPCEKTMAQVGGPYVSNIIYPGQQPLNAATTKQDLTNGKGINFDVSTQDDYYVTVVFNSNTNLGSITVTGNTNVFQVQLLDKNQQPITDQNGAVTLTSTPGSNPPTIPNFGPVGTSIFGINVLLISTSDGRHEFLN